MDLAIMQPYIFPYIGYYQLIYAVDKFILYDDVTFIKGGWINRNNILINGTASLFTVPLTGASSNREIGAIEINEKMYPIWKKKFLKSLSQNYSSAPFYDDVFPLIEEVLNVSSCSISTLAGRSLLAVCEHLKINTEFVNSSSVYGNHHLSGKDRVIDICKKEDAEHYINPIGGKELYDKSDFEGEGLHLSFIQTGEISYTQSKGDFVPYLSIIDVLMFNSKTETLKLMQNYQLV
ncbi:WbqC-like protein family protein [Nonlabens sp. Hel1_33_55]|uniref:WbqC family protein n=1 Tax=Nonlabens sp. Hel1_33_55 TaxID=1336802 RepID=UPI000875C2AC|nr:WbqC family protein [Nonlabens sp. Hel1_33_55]SCX94236.1 WbqC-like protein family protein [Nonlabens sp. Hel1_33_55]